MGFASVAAQAVASQTCCTQSQYNGNALWVNNNGPTGTCGYLQSKKYWMQPPGVTGEMMGGDCVSAKTLLALKSNCVQMPNWSDKSGAYYCKQGGSGVQLQCVAGKKHISVQVNGVTVSAIPCGDRPIGAAELCTTCAATWKIGMQ